eukprot:TRINITY_DN3007_c0_g1_i1.p1 TRINITY_DN3007_c0_g1~~TRINITY_DN3007_c0_g1_i1.p1  ORF type:complete len:693 (+),score=168.13 TRINITY_DN3007_c0_g1_i1:34-2079(+)
MKLSPKRFPFYSPPPIISLKYSNQTKNLYILRKTCQIEVYETKNNFFLKQLICLPRSEYSSLAVTYSLHSLKDIIFVADTIGKVHQIDINTTRIEYSYDLYGNSILSMCFNASLQVLFCGCFDGTVKKYQLDEFDKLKLLPFIFNGHAPITSIASNKDFVFVGLGSGEAFRLTLDGSTAMEFAVAELGIDEPVAVLDITPLSHFSVANCDAAGFVSIFDGITGVRTSHVRLCGGPIHSLMFEGGLLFAAAADGSLSVFSQLNDEWTLSKTHRVFGLDINSIAYTGKHVICGGENAQLALFKTKNIHTNKTFEKMPLLPIQHRHQVYKFERRVIIPVLNRLLVIDDEELKSVIELDCGAISVVAGSSNGNMLFVGNSSETWLFAFDGDNYEDIQAIAIESPLNNGCIDAQFINDELLVIFAVNGKVAIVDLDNFTFSIAEYIHEAIPLSLYVDCNDGLIYSIDDSNLIACHDINGSNKWKSQISARISRMVCLKEDILIALFNSSIIALTKKDGLVSNQKVKKIMNALKKSNVTNKSISAPISFSAVSTDNFYLAYPGLIAIYMKDNDSLKNNTKKEEEDSQLSKEYISLRNAAFNRIDSIMNESADPLFRFRFQKYLSQGSHHYQSKNTTVYKNWRFFSKDISGTFGEFNIKVDEIELLTASYALLYAGDVSGIKRHKYGR